MYQEKLRWAAVMENGEIIDQYQEEKTLSSEDIPRNGLRKFLLIDSDNTIVFVKELSPGWKFFYRRRTALSTGGRFE